VHLIGFYYKNILRCTVLWMSDLWLTSFKLNYIHTYTHIYLKKFQISLHTTRRPTTQLQWYTYNQSKSTALLDTQHLNVTMLFYQPVSHTTLNWQRLKIKENEHNFTIYINVTKLRLKVASTTGIPLHILQLHLHAFKFLMWLTYDPRLWNETFLNLM
jgi:hypothetical protein